MSNYPIYHPPTEAPFFMGAIVEVIECSDDSADSTHIGRIGRIHSYDYNSHVGQSHPSDPLIIVDFCNGELHSFWVEELAQLIRVQS